MSDQLQDEQVEAERPPGEAWLRTAQLLDVSFPDRTIELIVMPYEIPAYVGWEGRMVQEVIGRGAFDGIQRRANRVRVNREHERVLTIGRAFAFHPSRQEGLVAEVKIAKTDLGDETLELAADGCLDASAGFLPMKDGMQWETRSRYRVSKAWLEHIAMTSEPAHAGAKVLEVRSQALPASSTPNLDHWRSVLLDDRVASDPALNR